MSFSASIIRDGVEFEIWLVGRDRLSVSPGLEVDVCGSPAEKLRARQEALRIEADLDRLLHRPAYDVEADEDGWKVWPGSNRHLRLVVTNYGAEIGIDMLDEEDASEALEAAFVEFDPELHPRELLREPGYASARELRAGAEAIVEKILADEIDRELPG